jgi:hypothetical protein
MRSPEILGRGKRPRDPLQIGQDQLGWGFGKFLGKGPEPAIQIGDDKIVLRGEYIAWQYRPESNLPTSRAPAPGPTWLPKAQSP